MMNKIFLGKISGGIVLATIDGTEAEIPDAKIMGLGEYDSSAFIVANELGFFAFPDKNNDFNNLLPLLSRLADSVAKIGASVAVEGSPINTGQSEAAAEIKAQIDGFKLT